MIRKSCGNSFLIHNEHSQLMCTSLNLQNLNRHVVFSWCHLSIKNVWSCRGKSELMLLNPTVWDLIKPVNVPFHHDSACGSWICSDVVSDMWDEFLRHIAHNLEYSGLRLTWLRLILSIAYCYRNHLVPIFSIHSFVKIIALCDRYIG